MIATLVRAFVGMIIIFTVSTGSVAASPDDGGYRIGVGDVLHISVWKDESLTQQITVLPDGTISFPLIGRVQAEGKQLDELKQIISERLSRFVPDPILSVQVLRINSLMIYVIGKVNRPGRFELADNINVLQALALAGGLNPFARSSRIKIFRETGEKTVLMPFDYDAVSSGEDLQQNIELERGDVIVVP
jgi:polysaccharide export outer membrane protein